MGRGERDRGRKRRRKNVYLCVQYFRPLRSQVELDPSEGTLQRDPPDKQDRQHQVGEGRCEIHHLQHRAQTHQHMNASPCSADSSLSHKKYGKIWPSVQEPGASPQEGKAKRQKSFWKGFPPLILTLPDDLTPLIRQRKTTSQERARQPRMGRRTSPMLPIPSET